jgi:hypothetical protein
MTELSAETLNQGLNMALEWGENFGKPIGPRLAALYPELSAEQLEKCEKVCEEVKSFAFQVLYELYGAGHKDPTAAQYHNVVRAKYPWVSSENLSRLLTQGRYYAWRDFG